MPEPKLQKAEVAPGSDESGAAASTHSAEPLTLTAYRLKPVTMKIVPASEERDWMDWHENGAYRCLPLRIANQMGWFVLNDCAFEVVWTGRPHKDSLKIKYPTGHESKFVRNLFGHGILTWQIPYLFRTPPGYNLLVRGPTNWLKDGASPLDGTVETDWAVATFTMNWKLTRPSWKVRFQKDEPICMIIPQRRGQVEVFRPEIRNIESDRELEEGHRKWAEARRQLVAEKKVLFEELKRGLNQGKVAPWQPHYFRGKAPGGEVAEEHQIRLQIRPFEELEPPLEVSTGPSSEASYTPLHKSRPSAWDRFKRLWKPGP